MNQSTGITRRNVRPSDTQESLNLMSSRWLKVGDEVYLASGSSPMRIINLSRCWEDGTTSALCCWESNGIWRAAEYGTHCLTRNKPTYAEHVFVSGEAKQACNARTHDMPASGSAEATAEATAAQASRIAELERQVATLTGTNAELLRMIAERPKPPEIMGASVDMGQVLCDAMFIRPGAMRGYSTSP